MSPKRVDLFREQPGTFDPVTGDQTPAIEELVWEGRCDVVDDVAALQKYADGDDRLTRNGLMVFLPSDRVFDLTAPNDRVRVYAGRGVVLTGTITAHQRTGRMLLVRKDPLHR